VAIDAQAVFVSRAADFVYRPGATDHLIGDRLRVRPSSIVRGMTQSHEGGSSEVEMVHQNTRASPTIHNHPQLGGDPA